MSGDQVQLHARPSEPAAVAVEGELHPAGAIDQPADPPAGESAADSPSWSNLWQAPSLLISTLLIGLGIYAAARPPASNDFDGALAQVEQFLAAGELDRAQAQLRQVIEPHLPQATAAQQARFHADVADYLAAYCQSQGISDEASRRQISDQYQESLDLGLALSPLRQERWAGALLALGERAAAAQRLAALDALIQAPAQDNPAALADLTACRARILRHYVESGLQCADASFEELMRLLSDYRMDRTTSVAEETWAIARQTELRLQSGATRQAVDLLLVEMRRLESRNISDASTPPHTPTAFAELYVLLGRGYFELGDSARAQAYLEHALQMFMGAETGHGDALVLLGQIAVADGNPDAALEHFQAVVRDFITTRSYLPGLLGRAEVQSVLGSHQASLADYATLSDLLPKAGSRQDVTPQRVATSLCDRHDAALALGHLDRALDYAAVAESLFSAGQVPPDVLFRLASTHRQIADNLLAQVAAGGGQQGETETVEPPLIDPAVRHEANVHYELAGNYYLRHASAETSASSTAPDPSTAQWLAADSYDRGGRQDRAIQEFTRFMESHSIDDPRRPETLFRIAQAHHATMDYDRAIAFYEQLTADVGGAARTSFAAQSYVPLAQCYLALNRRPQAKQLLRQVLAGDRLLTPEARDYRDALIEMGRIEYLGDEFTAAIEEFTQVIDRYPADPRAGEIRFLLADSYRSNAMAIGERLKMDANIAPAESERLIALRREQLQTAQRLFVQFGEAAGAGGEHSVGGRYQQDLVRRAAMYRADCAFYLEQFNEAIELYDRAARQYSGHPGSMYALIQIVNCYHALGDAERAAAAHQRALVRLKQLPDDAFTSPDSLMDRAAWERWLDNNPVGPSPTSSANASSG